MLIKTLALIFLSHCTNDKINPDYKQKMREFVINISQYAKSNKQKFFIVPQNGIELVTINGDVSGQPHIAYLNAIDGNGQEDLFYGYNSDDQATPSEISNYLKALLNISKNAGNTILVIDYCLTQSKINDSYLQSYNAGYLSFAADH